jgi:hypothetical protein
VCSVFSNEVGRMSSCILDEMIVLGRENGGKYLSHKMDTSKAVRTRSYSKETDR